MLDAELKSQLKDLFAQLQSKIELAVELSTHPDQAELLNLLEAVAETSPQQLQVSKVIPAPGLIPSAPRFQILKDGQSTGIVFSAIPTGHEFSSLILGILNADGRGKWPDKILSERIAKLKGPIEVQTYISLSCENCPDVVQSLNQMSLIHGHFRHETIDGAYCEDEIKKLGIQGVPSIVVNGKMIHSGRIGLLDLVAKLESVFGIDEQGGLSVSADRELDLGKVDVLVVGGGPAGASAAIYSARKGLKTTLVTEKIGGQVQETRGIENLISVPYTEGPQLAGQLANHVAQYPVQLLEHRRVKTVELEETKDGLTKLVHLESGEFIRANAVIVTTGAKWRELGVKGEREYIGRGVAFCPHCDGPYYKGKKVAVIGGGNSGVEAAIDLSGIVGEVVLIEYSAQLKADKILVDKLSQLKNVSVLTNAQTQIIEGDGQKVVGLSYLDRAANETKALSLDGVFVQIGLVPNSQFLKGVVELNSFGEVVVDAKGRTSIRGIYAAGDVTTTPYKQIIIAMGEGAKAALAAFEDRMMEPS